MMERQSAYASVAFKKRGGAFRGSVPVGDLSLLPNDPAETMREVTAIYQNALDDIKRWQKDASELGKSKRPMTVRKVWELGDILHHLNASLTELGCHLENPYDHLERHAGIPAKRASSFVTLRRYVADAELIPENLQWNKILKTVKSTSLAIADGSFSEIQT